MQLIRPDQAASILSVSKRTIYRMVEDGDLPCIKVRGALRITAEGLEKYLHKRMQLSALDRGFTHKKLN